jgi:hypothetical protein
MTTKYITAEEMFELFDQQMNIVSLSLATSFRKYATRRDETIEQFANHFRVPAKLFEDRLIEKQIEELTK